MLYLSLVLVAIFELACGRSAAQGPGNVERGRVLAGWYGCASCHRLGNSTVAGNVGPPLTGLRERAYLAGRLPHTDRNLVHWIRYPQQVDPATVMPDMGVTEEDARDIAAYLYTLR